jgi:hypothetical protein
MRVGASVPYPLILIRVQSRGTVSQNYKSGPRRLIYYGSSISGTVVGTYHISTPYILKLTKLWVNLRKLLFKLLWSRKNITMFCPVPIPYIHSIHFKADQAMGKTMSGSRKFTENFFYSHLKSWFVQEKI